LELIEYMEPWLADAQVTSPLNQALASDCIEEEIAELYRSHSAKMLRYAQTLASDRDTARDAVQEAFVRYFELRQGTSIDNPYACLLRVLRNYLIDLSRRACHRLETQVPPGLPDTDSRNDPGFRCAQIDLWQKMERSLSPKEFECLRLREIGFTYAEIGEAVGVGTGTVGSFLARAHAKGRCALGHRPKES